MNKKKIHKRDISKLVHKGGTVLLPFVIIAFFWEGFSRTVIAADYFPPLSVIIPFSVEMILSGEFTSHLVATLFRGFTGLFISVLIGIPVGLLVTQSKFVRKQVEPLLSLTYPSPKAPLIPLVVFWLGVGHTSRIFLAVIGALIPIVISTINGADNVKQELIWSAESYGITDKKLLYKVILPAGLPSILTGIRLGMVFSFIIVISSEMIVARSGVGTLVQAFASQGRYVEFFGVSLLIALVVASIDRLYLYLSNKYLLHWSKKGVSGI